MIRILCYGDSNTWGWNPSTKERYHEDERWTGVLKKELGNEYIIIEEGLNGRTTVWDDPIEGYRNGKEYLIPCLETHKPLDFVIILLGTNDLKRRFCLSAYDIAQGAGVLIDIVNKSNAGRNENPPKAMLIAPPSLGKLTEYSEMFNGGQDKSRDFFKYFREVAKDYSCEYLDASTIVKSSNIDGIHLDKEQHKLLGKAIAHVVKGIFNQ